MRPTMRGCVPFHSRQGPRRRRHTPLSYCASLVSNPLCEIMPVSIDIVRPTNLQPMKKVYAGLPNVKVEPLHFAPEDISGDRLLAMMKVDENSRRFPPLNMKHI